MKTVRFLQKQSPYNAGEIAGFPDDLATKYVSAKVAEFVSSSVPSHAERPQNPAEWEQLLRECVDYHEKQIKDLRVLLIEAETARDQFKARVAELEGLLAQALAQTSTKPEVDNPAPAGPVDASAAPIDATSKSDGGAQENASGSETTAAGKKTGRK
jgi:hypothetical protein